MSDSSDIVRRPDGTGARAAAEEGRLRKLGLETRWRWAWECRVIVSIRRGMDLGCHERPGPSPAVMAINLLLSSNEII